MFTMWIYGLKIFFERPYFFILRHFNRARLWASGLPAAIGIMLLNTKKYNILAVIHIFIRLREFHLYDVICIRRMQHHRYLKIIIFSSVLKCSKIFGFVFIMRIIKRRLLTYGHMKAIRCNIKSKLDIWGKKFITFALCVKYERIVICAYVNNLLMICAIYHFSVS